MSTTSPSASGRHRSHGVLPPQACSVLSRQIEEPLAGTAPEACAWIGIEQPGPWGAKALLESHLPDGIGRRVIEKFDDSSVTALLIRRPGTHADPRAVSPHDHRRTLLVAFAGSNDPHGRPASSPWLLRTTTIGDDGLAATIADLDPDAIARGSKPAGSWVAQEARIALICTNGKRDTCCAVSGRLLLDDVVESMPDEEIWECSHPGGHRFAPTVVLLPDGLVLGRGSVEDIRRGLRGEQVTSVLRGRSCLTRSAQAAEIAVLQLLTDDTTPSALEVGESEDEGVFIVRHPDGRRWLVRTAARQADAAAPASCGKEPEVRSRWMTEPPQPLEVRQDDRRDDDSLF